MEKVCGKCNRLLPDSEFHMDARASDFLNWQCKACKAEHSKEVYRKSVERTARPGMCVVCGGDADGESTVHIACLERLLSHEQAAPGKDQRHYRKVEGLNRKIASLEKQLVEERKAQENDAKMTMKQVNELLQLRDTNRDLRAALQRRRDECAELRAKIARMEQVRKPYGN
jgi:hypothetical protein